MVYLHVHALVGDGGIGGGVGFVKPIAAELLECVPDLFGLLF
jgi:hypothetical protein